MTIVVGLFELRTVGVSDRVALKNAKTNNCAFLTIDRFTTRRYRITIVPPCTIFSKTRI